MKILLDTCSFLWWIKGSRQIGPTAKTLISDSENEIFLSAVSVWEISIKILIGKLKLTQPLAVLLAEQLQINNFQPLNISIRHSIKAVELKKIHADPFGRMLVSQAICEKMILVSPDPIIAQYPIKCEW